jgi:hypothetical protein
MNINFKITGVDEIKAFVKALPRGVKIVAMRAITTHILGDKQHGLRHEPSYKYVSRKSAYGFTFFTEKQRRWFWANGGPDMIGNNRTHNIADGWTMKESNSDWSRVSIANEVDGVGWVMGTQQARQPAKVGWRDYMKIIESNMAGAMRAGRAAVQDYINSRGRSV